MGQDLASPPRVSVLFLRAMKTTTLLCSLAALLCLTQAAQADRCLPLKARHPEGNYIVPGVRGDIVYRRAGGIELSLDAYVQKRGARRPAVIVIHGGQWDTGSRIAFTGQLLELLTAAGYNWFAVDYRLGGLPRYRDALADLRAAIAFIRCHASALRIDPDNLALLGEDAGAHLAALLAAEKPAGVQAAVLLGGFYDLHETPNLKSQISNPQSQISAALLTHAAPSNQDLRAMPATLVVHGGNDRESPPPQAGRYCAAIRQAGRHCEYFVVEGATHRAENWWPTQWDYKRFVTAWLAKQLSLARPDHEPFVTNLKKDIVFSPRHKLKLDAYIPPGLGPFPAVIIAHGGGWEAGDKVTYVTPLFAPLAAAGFAWFSIDYRLTPQFRHEEQLADLRAAINYVARHAASFRVDPRRIALLGESASGQMVAQLATESPPHVAAVVSFYGVYDFFQMDLQIAPRSLPARLFGLTKLDDEARQVLWRHSPFYHVHDRMPSLLLIHGTNERLYAQGVALTKRLSERHADYDFYEVEHAPHGLENWEGHAEWLGYKQKLVNWLKNKLSGRK